MKISVIIPVFNEEKTIKTLVERVLSIPFDKELVLIDDGSSDGSAAALRDLAAKNEGVISCFFHPKNQGKGAALRTGFQHATGDYVIVQDADLEYDPRDIPRLIEPLLEGRAEVVYGTRFQGKTPRDLYREGNMHWAHWLGNKGLTLITNLLYGSNLTDMETCYKLVPRAFIQSITLRSDRFNFEPEITAKILKRGLRIREVPISYTGRAMQEGKNISWRDGPSAVWALITYRFID